jgi:cytoskeletal protein CcmA (bactofilin family)
MFHRVKSELENKSEETQNVQTDIEETVEQEEAQAEVQDEQVEEAQEQDTIATDTVASEAEETQQEAPKPAGNLYQRANPSQVRPSAGFTSPSQYGRAATSQYAAPAQPAPTQPAPAADLSGSDRRLTIGRGITMSGEIEHCDNLVVEGTVEAALRGASSLTIAESGVFYGTVEIEDAVIAGRFEGEIVVNGRLTVESTGVITGTIAYKELQIEAGAVLDGRLSPISAAQSQSAGKPAAAKKKPAQKQETAEEGGLFSSAVEAAE